MPGAKDTPGGGGCILVGCTLDCALCCIRRTLVAGIGKLGSDDFVESELGVTFDVFVGGGNTWAPTCTDGGRIGR